MARARIKLASVDKDKLNELIDAIKAITEKSGVIMKGPIPLPTRKLKITTRKSPCGDGKASFDRFQMDIYKRIIEVPVDEKVLHSIMRLNIPKDINIEISMLD
ncbi:30S ribosomal protein S10 [Candidatus Pacearchaeota archaeon CG_4_9_14_3_um_filter_31_7]|nr:MAG: 30S ribosomal protein S10 [Candidatus Pacearchaeota archaeon CG1_02_31_27]PIN92072.1 MAG: 30S ribosomal protein S10 [Candidatus Pacearchaeota archaeon CG10_big_fil_rev_8_21_14_0_10_31_59]PIZ80286.1 MAG: 30S ribosomal protein S10 [Candidatus Pacearchaeota archaeon CG_4_10_14_0_2_um_filter_31_10]PJA70756.1 MAG: 30S ribosomal protein S10 [Candidatus Pacearchaeota archaeon CG_4_9_14_3_um_filter_31_7]